MTIGVGFVCPDGIVICADTEMSNGFMKFSENKIYPFGLRGSKGQCALAITYAGNQALMKSFRDRLSVVIRDPAFDANPDSVEEIVKDTLQGMGGSLFDSAGNPDLYLLCGIAQKGHRPVMLKAQASTVHRVDDGFDFVGVGDSSVVRFLSKVLGTSTVSSIGTGAKLGTYIVAQAKKYVSGCGGDTDILLINPDGKVVDYGIAYPFIEDAASLIETFFQGLVVTARMPDVMEKEFKQMKSQFLDELTNFSHKDIFDFV